MREADNHHYKQVKILCQQSLEIVTFAPKFGGVGVREQLRIKKIGLVFEKRTDKLDYSQKSYKSRDLKSLLRKGEHNGGYF